MPAKDFLEHSDAEFRLLFENNPLPMWVFDRQTLRFLEANHAAVVHYGYSRDEFLAMTVADIRPPEDVARLQDAVVRASGLALSGQWRHRLKDGRAIDVEVASHTISYGGRPAVLSALHDVTERNRLEEQLRQSAKMEAVGMLAGGIAHDFNNLLTIINGYSQMLLEALPAADANRSAVEQIMKAGERAAGLTRQLLMHSRRQALQPKLLNLNQVLTGMEAMLRRLIGEDVELCFARGGEIGQVKADSGQIEQVVMNLAVNARDAMPRAKHNSTSSPISRRSMASIPVVDSDSVASAGPRLPAAVHRNWRVSPAARSPAFMICSTALRFASAAGSTSSSIWL